MAMPTVNDVAAYILKKHGTMTAMKLHKLMYYAQAWSLVWDEKPLFKNRIEAWANGPVVPWLYRLHRGKFELSIGEIPEADYSTLSDEQRKTVKAVLEFYGNKPPQWLSDLTHSEKPWRDARRGLAPGERGKNEITTAAMHEYYGSL
jgi:uncharacterized phage-associated protein